MDRLLFQLSRTCIKTTIERSEYALVGLCSLPLASKLDQLHLFEFLSHSWRRVRTKEYEGLILQILWSDIKEGNFNPAKPVYGNLAFLPFSSSISMLGGNRCAGLGIVLLRLEDGTSLVVDTSPVLSMRAAAKAEPYSLLFL